MPTSALETLARLRVCRAAGIAVPHDLQDAAIECLSKVAGHAELKARRDALIRRAAMALPPGGAYRNAEILAQEAKVIGRSRLAPLSVGTHAEPVTARQCLLAASQILELPTSVRQYYRVIQSSATDTKGD